MWTSEETLQRLAAIPNLKVATHVPLSGHTRFGIGGPADLFAETDQPDAFISALRTARESGRDHVVIGGGTNLIVSDEGFPGVVLRLTASRITAEGGVVTAEAGALLQHLVDFTVSRGLKGLETMTGIPGSVGAAIYGNAGAYGHSISERARQVRLFDGNAIRTISNSECQFHYRESVFKKNKDWIIFSVDMLLDPADPAELTQTAHGILSVRNEKYPPSMKCAGSIFKNFLLSELPASAAGTVPSAVIREGKVPSAYFLEQVGAKGMRRGDIEIATYHANLIYNAGHGSARDLVALIGELKQRVRDRFDIDIEEEVQYVGITQPETAPLNGVSS